MLDPNEPNDLKSIEKCRQINKTIIEYGVSNNEIKKIIELLSLELEDINLMKEINNLLKKDITLNKEEKLEFERK